MTSNSILDSAYSAHANHPGGYRFEQCPHDRCRLFRESARAEYSASVVIDSVDTGLPLRFDTPEAIAEAVYGRLRVADALTSSSDDDEGLNWWRAEHHTRVAAVLATMYGHALASRWEAEAEAAEDARVEQAARVSSLFKSYVPEPDRKVRLRDVKLTEEWPDLATFGVPEYTAEVGSEFRAGTFYDAPVGGNRLEPDADGNVYVEPDADGRAVVYVGKEAPADMRTEDEFRPTCPGADEETVTVATPFTALNSEDLDAIEAAEDSGAVDEIVLMSGVDENGTRWSVAAMDDDESDN